MTAGDHTNFLYKPSKWQAEFHALPHDEALGAGSVGPGKTMALIHEPLSQIQIEHARCSGDFEGIGPKGHWLRELAEANPLKWGMSRGWALYLRRTGSTVDQVVSSLKKTLLRLDPGCTFHEQKKQFKFSSGYVYQVGHCHNIGDWANYYSCEFSSINFDELVQFDEEQYEQICSRLRSSDPVLRHMLKIRAMSNPATSAESGATVRDIHWVRRRFVDEAPEGRVTLKKKVARKDGRIETLTRIYLPAKLHDNPDPEFVEQYERRLLNLPSHMRKALIEGNWYVKANSFFAEAWDSKLHVCKPFKIPGTWKRFRSMDWGFKSYGVIHWWAMDEDGNLFCEKEYTFQRKLDIKVAKEVRDIESLGGLWKSRRSLITGPADTQLWEERGDSGKTKAQRFMDKGVPWVKASKSRRAAAERIMHRLLDHDHGTTTPGLVFFDTCRHAIRTIPGLPTDPDNMEVPLDGGEDHWFDSVGYACAFASNGRAGIPSIHRDEQKSERRAPDRGRYGYG